jgi:hypothetical protein
MPGVGREPEAHGRRPDAPTAAPARQPKSFLKVSAEFAEDCGVPGGLAGLPAQALQRSSRSKGERSGRERIRQGTGSGALRLAAVLQFAPRHGDREAAAVPARHAPDHDRDNGHRERDRLWVTTGGSVGVSSV